MTEKYRLDLAPHILVPIHNRQEYQILATITVQVQLSSKEQKVLYQLSRMKMASALDVFYLKEFVAKQVQEQVRKEFPKAAFANIVYAHKAFKGKPREVDVEVDILR